LFAPAHDGIGHAANQLADRSLALAGSWLAVKIFAGHDVSSRLRPAARHLHIVLAENRYTLFVPDQCGTLLPFDGIERRNLAVGEEPLESESFSRCCFCGSHCLACQRRLYCCHRSSCAPASGLLATLSSGKAPTRENPSILPLRLQRRYSAPQPD